MVGKASLIVVTGFSILFLTVVQNFGSITNRAVDNYVDYHQKTISRNIAVSGANIGANIKYRDPYYIGDFPNISFQGGKIDLRIQNNSIMAIGSYKGMKDTVKIVLEKTMFSDFAYYSMWEKDSPTGGPIWWTNKDTVNGPFHTQDDLRAYRHPVFKGEITSHKGSLIYYDNKWLDKPYIYGEYKPGYDLEIPTGSVDNLEGPANSNGLYFTGHDTVYLNFDKDTLRYRYSYSGIDSVLYLPARAPNGVIFAKDAVVRLKGVVRGQYTLGVSAPGSGSTVNKSKGKVFLDDDIVYKSNPLIYPDSTDLFGICAENNIWITKNSANNSNININAALFSETEGFGAEYYDTRPVSGDINLLGGLSQYWRKPVGTFSGGVIQHGFTKQYNYDYRFGNVSPPYFPGTGGFKIVSWLE
jgi:hypothetical protein